MTNVFIGRRIGANLSMAPPTPVRCATARAVRD
jgi:hypothetical protein